MDDHPVVRDGYRCLLENTGEIRVVAEAGDGEQAYKAYKSHEPDVTIMDLCLPGASGLDTIHRIVRRDPEARVMVFSMHESAVYQRRSIEAGAVGYVCKRSPPDVMLEAVREVSKGGRFFALGDGEGAALDNDQLALQSLTLREFEVFRLLALGRSVQGIAGLLNISHNTAGVHQTRIMKKLGLENAAQLTRMAIRNDVVKA